MISCISGENHSDGDRDRERASERASERLDCLHGETNNYHLADFVLGRSNTSQGNQSSTRKIPRRGNSSTASSDYTIRRQALALWENMTSSRNAQVDGMGTARLTKPSNSRDRSSVVVVAPAADNSSEVPSESVKLSFPDQACSDLSRGRSAIPVAVLVAHKAVGRILVEGCNLAEGSRLEGSLVADSLVLGSLAEDVVGICGRWCWLAWFPARDVGR
ncbi:hypothetical protein BJX64DRAFT_248396 [Aspergillus heterothallicus]